MEVPVYNLSGIDGFNNNLKKVRKKVKAAKLQQPQANNINADNAKIAAILRNAAQMIEEQAVSYQNGLSGVEGIKAAVKRAGKAVKKASRTSTANEKKILKSTAVRAVKKALNTVNSNNTVNNKYIANVLFNSANYIKAVADMYDKGTIKNTLRGIYNEYLKIKDPTPTQTVDAKKARVLLGLQGIGDIHGYQLASIYMPYVSDIDEKDGGYIFDNEDIANIAATGEDNLRTLEINNADEQQFGKLFKKIKKAVKKVATAAKKAVKTVAKSTAKVVKAAVVNPVKATVKSTANVVKATANVVKAGAQAATGNAAKAKATLKKAGTQIKKAVVEPVKTAAQSTKTIVKETIVNPTKTAAKAVAKTIKIAGKVFKVIFIKINPVTVLMRNALRGLVALNFVGMATRLNVANMTKENAIAAGYTEQQYNDAVKAKKRVVSFFTKMGGKKENIEKAIVNGAKRKALFKKDYNSNQKIIENADGTAQLGFEPGTIGAALSAVGAFFAKIWKWIKNIVPKVVNVVKKGADVAKKVLDKVGANKGADTEQYAEELPPVNEEEPKKFPWGIVAAAGGVVLLLATKK